MHSLVRRAFVAVLALVMTLALPGFAFAGDPAFRNAPAATRPDPAVVMRGSGWGHGVGMSQFGAFAQSRAGWGYHRILNHYYSSIDIEQRTMPSSIRVGLNPAMELSYVDAVTGQVPWRARVDGKWVTEWQPRGTTWKVARTSTGAFRLTQDGEWIRTFDATRLVASFNRTADPAGTVVEAYNPNYDLRSEYKWGRLEYTASASSAGDMNLTLEVPSLELYLRGLAEMPAGWGAAGGDAALQAQAVVGRSYALVLRGTYEAPCRCHIIATPANQTYMGWDHEGGYAGSEWVAAVRNTAGVVATYEGTPIAAFYSSSHGGRSENIEDSWAYSSFRGYVRSVDDDWSLRAPGNDYASWEHVVSNDSFAGFVGSTMGQVRSVQIVGRTEGGSPRSLRVSGLTWGGDPMTTTRSGTRDIAAIDLRYYYGLRSQQVRSIGFLPFTDDDGSPHEYATVFATQAGIMSGKSATRFGPGGVVRRSHAAQHLYRMLKLPAATTDYYSDDDDKPAGVEEAINALAKAGISGGLRRGLFRPDDKLTRSQAASLFFRALQLTAPAPDYYSDDNGSKPEAAINAMTRKGLLQGCGPQRFCPDRVMRRGPMATLLYRSVEAFR